MKKLAFVLLLVLLVLGGGSVYLMTAFPKVGVAPDLKVETNPMRLEHGRYLAENVCACLDCHSQRDWTRYTGPLIRGTEGKGGEKFSLPVGDLYAPNLTPTHLAGWSDGELYRAIACGVSKDGHPLFPLMPYLRYGKLPAEDIYSIIAYLRTLKPLPDSTPASRLNFPLNLIVRTIPQPARPEVLPPGADELARGKFLCGAAACADCHTPQKKGTPIPGMEFAGGMEFTLPDGAKIRSANITPSATGLGNWDKKLFVGRFKKTVTPALTPGQVNTVMPWSIYAGMTEEDLSALYTYLRTVPPVESSDH